jgi:hypothetical protein
MDFQLPTTLIGWLLLAALIIPIAITVIGFRPAVSYLRNHLHGNAFEILRKWAYTYVAALAQDPTLKGLASEEKKQQAVIWLVVRAKGLGIDLTEREASNLVEEAVYLVKNVALPNLKDTLATAG